MSHIPVGDHGQRYELWARLDGQRMQLGWVTAEKLTLGINSWRKHPAVTTIRVIDRQEPKNITCHDCGMTSFNPGDIENLYCGKCKTFLQRG